MRAPRDRRRCAARPTRRPRRRSARAAPTRRGARRPARGSRRRSSRRSARSGSTRRRVSAWSARATSSSSPARTCSASAPWAASGSITSGSSAQADLVREPEPVEPAGREHDRVEPALAQLAQARVDVAAQRLDRERRLEREQLRRAGARTRCRCACRAGSPRRRRARRADRRARRYAPTTSPSVSLEVMSFAECTATSMRPASSASSISLTKTPRAPIWPNGLLAVAVAGGRDRDERDLDARRAAAARRPARPG